MSQQQWTAVALLHYSTIHRSVCVGVTVCVAVTVGSESEDDDNDDEEEDDEECLKKLRQKVCMHVYSMWD